MSKVLIKLKPRAHNWMALCLQKPPQGTCGILIITLQSKLVRIYSYYEHNTVQVYMQDALFLIAIVLALLTLCSLALVLPAGATAPSPTLVATSLIVGQRETLEEINATDMRELRFTCSIAFHQQQHEHLLKEPFTIQFRRHPVVILTVCVVPHVGMCSPSLTS